MAITVPTPVDTGTTTTVTGGPPSRVPAAVPPGPGTTGTVVTAPAPMGPPETAPPAVVPGAGIGQSAQAAAIPAVPVAEAPVDTGGAISGSTTNVVPRPVPNYIEILSDGTIVVQNATALNFIGNGVSITANSSVATLTINTAGYSNSNVSTYLAGFGSNVLSTTGNVTGGYFIGNGSQLTGVAAGYGNANVVANLAALGSNPVSTTGNVTAGNLNATGFSLSGNVVSALNLTANITTTSNISSNYFIGNGSQLTGIAAGYGNANVVANLAALGSNPVSTTGNIAAGYILGNGSQLTGIAATYGNANVAANLAAFGSNPISTSGNITGGNIINSGISTVTGNITGGNLLTGGLISATGNITGGNLSGTSITGTLTTGTQAAITGVGTLTNMSTSGNANVTGDVNSARVSATGNITGGNLITSAAISAASVSASGNITAGNLNAAGMSLSSNVVSALNVTGAIAGANVTTPGLISATGNITGGNVLGGANVNATTHTGTTVSVSGNITGGNIATAGQVSATGNITTSNSFVGNLVGTTVSVTGNVSAGNVIVNGQPTTYGYVNGAYLLAQNTTDQSVGLNDAVNFQTTSASNGSIITKTSDPRVTLTAGNTYKLEGIIRRLSSSSTWAAFRWYDVTNSAYVGIEGFSEVTNSPSAIGSTVVATGIVTPTVNTIYELRQTTVNTISVSGGYAGYEITQINPAIAVQATATGTVAATVVANTSPVSGTNFNGGSSVSPALTVMTLAIPSAGTWRLDAEMRVYIPGEGYMAAGFYNNGTLISGSEYFIAAGGVTQTGAATGQYGGFMSYNLTTTGATTVTMGAWATGTSQFITSDDGRTWARATQIDSIFALNTLATMSLTGNITTTGNVSATGNVTGGNVLTGGVISSTGNITGGNISATNHTGTTVSVTGNITAANFFGNGNTLSNVATQVAGSWTVPVGNSTQSFTVNNVGTYSMWVDCNITNGILAWNATATVTNNNVPVVGAQYAWVYNGGGSPVDFTSIPNQFIGTANTIVRSSTSASATTNRFDFGINNTSGDNVTVRYGYVKIS